jgi:hypothetical protein
MSQWQTIETAPKDGTLIIAYQPGGTYSNGIAYPATVGTASWQRDGVGGYGWWGPYNPRDYPTHWMPLPDPPTVEPNSTNDDWHLPRTE